MNEFVEVPYYMEKDGKKTFFLPNLRMASGYRVGAKGAEKTFHSYWDALEYLHSMGPPIFRRPNGNGNFGGVKCEPDAREQVSRAFIESELAKYGG